MKRRAPFVGKQPTAMAPNLLTLVDRLHALPFEEGLELANRLGLTIASNHTIDQFLMGMEDRRDVALSFPCFTGTMLAFQGDKLNLDIRSPDPRGFDWVFPVPSRFKGLYGVALVVEHPHYTLVPGVSTLIVNADQKKVEVIENISFTDMGWFGIDLIHGIPQGSPQFESKSARRLLAPFPMQFVGPVARDCGFCGYTDAQNILTNYRNGYYNEAALIVEAPR